MSAYPILARAVDKMCQIEEQKLSSIRNAIMKAITANELEWQRESAKLMNKDNPTWNAVERCDREFRGMAEALRRALETVTIEACTQLQMNSVGRTIRRPPLVELLAFATQAQRARDAEKTAACDADQHEKARARDRRYRERLRQQPMPQPPQLLTYAPAVEVQMAVTEQRVAA
jgi:hypothetical protein